MVSTKSMTLILRLMVKHFQSFSILLTQFLPSEPDLTTTLDSSFAVNQDAVRKGVERGFGVLKLKFQVLTYPINLHHWDDIYYDFLACILM